MAVLDAMPGRPFMQPHSSTTDTVESLATRMAPFDHQIERFQVLNGLEPDEQLKAGDLVKIIVE